MSLPANEQILRYLIPNSEIDWDEGAIPTCKIHNWTKGMQSNAYFFGHSLYSEKYLKTENCSKAFGERWQSAIGSWDNKVAIDVGWPWKSICNNWWHSAIAHRHRH